MVWRRGAGFQLATFWTALSLISSINIMVSPPGTPGGVGGTVTVQGVFSTPLVVLSFQQLVVWAINADRAAGMHGSLADSRPPVAHFPAPLYVPMFYSSLWVDCFVLARVYMSHCCPYLLPDASLLIFWSSSNYTDCQHFQQVNNWFLKMSINYNFQMLIVFSMSFLFLV